MKLARAILRITIGVLFVGHGTQKLFGWFGGKGLDATAESFESMGLHPGRENALAAGATEALGGSLLALGAFTPVALGALVGVMITAVRTVHWKNGVWVTEGGYEYNLVLIAALLALAEGGPGPLSLDGALGHGSGSLLEAAGMLALGAAGSYATVEAAKRRAPTAAGAAA
jgi:putative oxidoreductase